MVGGDGLAEKGVGLGPIFWDLAPNRPQILPDPSTRGEPKGVIVQITQTQVQPGISGACSTFAQKLDPPVGPFYRGWASGTAPRQ